MESKGFLIKLIMKLKEKNPITYSLVRNLCSLSPVKIAFDKPESKERFKKVVKKIISTKWIDSSEGDILLTEYDNLLDSIPSIGVKKFSDFNPYKDRSQSGKQRAILSSHKIHQNDSDYITWTSSSGTWLFSE